MFSQTTEQSFSKKLSLLCIGLLSMMTPNIAIANSGTEGDCVKTAPTTVECNIYPRTGFTVSEATAIVAGTAAKVVSTAPVDASESEIAWYYLVDVSDPGRAEAVKSSVKAIDGLLSFEQPKHVYGLGQFATDFEAVVPGPASPAEIKAALDKVVAAGQTTELFNNTKAAIKALSLGYSQKRRVLVVFSDGNPEDKAYTLQSVIDDANNEDIMLAGVGLPPNTLGNTYLQNLEKMAEDTKGHFISSAVGTYEIKPEALEGFYKSFVNQVKVQVEVPEASAGKPIDVSLTLSDGTGLNFTGFIKDNLEPESFIQKYRILIICALLALLALLGLLLLLRKKQPEPDPLPIPVRPDPVPAPAPAPAPIITRGPEPARPVDVSELPPFAVVGLKPKNRPGSYQTIFRKLTTIGRSEDCDIVLADDTISRMHATIEYSNEKTCILRDLNSLNGSFVNGRKIELLDIKDGDEVKLGELTFTFEHVSTGN